MMLYHHDLISWFCVLLHVAIEDAPYREPNLEQTQDLFTATWGKDTLESLHHEGSGQVVVGTREVFYKPTDIKLHGQFGFGKVTVPSLPFRIPS